VRCGCLLLLVVCGIECAHAGQVELVAKGAFQITAKNRTAAPATEQEEGALSQLDADYAELDELGEGNAPPQTVHAPNAPAAAPAAVPASPPSQGLLTEEEAAAAGRAVSALRVKDLRIGAKGCKPVLSDKQMSTHCEIGGKLRFNFKPQINPALNSSKSKQLGLIKGLEYVFAANRSSVCVFAANCTSAVKLSQFSQSGGNDGKITAAFLKTKPKAAKSEQLSQLTKIKALVEHGVRKVGKMAILTLFS